MNPIWHIEQLQHIERIARRYNVSIRLRGGVVFRYLLSNRRPSDKGEHVDLFGLTPFTADVDLTHSGHPDLTQRLLDAILDEGQASECFRWELRADSAPPTISAVSATNVIPARSIQISQSPHDGIIDLAGGVRDINEGRFRYIRNPLFKQSPLYLQRRDLELFSALLYLQTLAEAGVSDPRQQPGWQMARQVFAEAQTDFDLPLLLQEHTYLRSRLRHLLQALSSVFFGREDYEGIAQDVGLLALVAGLHLSSNNTALDKSVLAFLSLDRPDAAGSLFTSERVGGDTHRLGKSGSNWTRSLPVGVPQLSFEESEEIVLVSPKIPVNRGSSENTYFTSLGQLELKPFRLNQNFIYASIDAALFKQDQNSASYIEKIKDEDISAIVLICDLNEKWSHFSFPVSATTKRDKNNKIVRLLLRINCLGVLDSDNSTAIHIAIVIYKDIRS
jgi:hypothetical protein